MFNDAQHRIPSLVLGMYECKGARRAATATRPHCFELMLKTGFMQLAAPDEYVASDWLQALVQAASGVSFCCCCVVGEVLVVKHLFLFVLPTVV